MADVPSGDDQHIAKLKDAIQAGWLVAIIGTGVSRQVAESLVLDGYEIVTWIGLVRHGIDRCRSLALITEEEAKELHVIVQMTNVSHLIHAAEVITQKLKKDGIGPYQTWLNDTIGKLKVKNPRLIHALTNIAAFIASLNYDTLPEQVTQRASVSWNRSDRVSDVVNGKKIHAAGADRDAILHPHGCWDDAESVILGTSSYRDVVGSKHAQAIQSFFAVGHTMMFAGCGGTFDDPNFAQFLPAATAILKDTTQAHFVLCRTGEVDGWKNKAPWLHPIAYGDNYEDLTPFLESLAKYRGEPPPEPAKIPPSSPSGGGSTIDAEWSKVTQKVAPDLMAELVTLGRKPAVEKLDQIAKGSLSELGLQTRFPCEITSFITGFLAKKKWLGTPEGERWKIIRDRDGWTAAAEEKGVRNILIADPDLEFESNQTVLTQAAAANGHAIVYATLLGRADDKNVIPLGQPSRHDLIELLKKNGIPAARAEKLAKQSNGNVPLLIRYLNGTADKPSWSTPQNISKLRILALLGGWRTDNPRDIAAVGEILGSDYHEWISNLFPILHGEEPPVVHNQNVFRPVSRYENWQLLAPYLTDADLARFQKAAIAALRADNPKFDFPSERRMLSGLKKTDSTPSDTLREGIAETLALLGGKSEALIQCSPNKAREVTFLVVQAVLAEADWKRWASLGSIVSLLAESDPEYYLRTIATDLARGESSAIRQLFSQVEGGIFGEFHHSGILWSLEVLAWKPELLNRVALILAELDQLSLPQNIGNRPIGSLRTILLPWLPQTLATIAERKTAVETVIRDFPETGWKLLLELLPEHHGVSGYNQRPLWRDWIPSERDEGTTNGERREQERIYAELALGLALKSAERLGKLFDHLLYLPEPAFRAIIDALKSDPVIGLPEQARFPLWQRVTDEVRNHRRFVDAEWAAPSDIINMLEEIAKLLEPKTPSVRLQYLFNNEYHYFSETGDYDADAHKTRKLRQNAVHELLTTVGIDGIFQFAQSVALPFHVGSALAEDGSEEIDARLLPKCIRADHKITEVCRGYVIHRFDRLGKDWLEKLPIKQWEADDIGTFFWWLPFTSEIWKTAESVLGDKASSYWRLVNVHPHGPPSEVRASVEKLLEVDLGVSAVRGVQQLIHDQQPVPAELALAAVKSFIRSYSKASQTDPFALREVIKFLQDHPDADEVELGRIEWLLLPLFDRHSGGSPVALERNLASTPSFFVEIIKACYRGKGEPKPPESEVTEETKRNAERGYRLLRNWSIPPGKLKGKAFDPIALEAWILEVKRLTDPSHHWEVAQTHIGQVLIHAPPDQSGLFVHHGVARILDKKEYDDMRRGYRIALFNQRGAYWVGGGKADREQQAIYETKAKAVDAVGFTNLAATLWSLAESYARDAEREEKRPSDD